MAKFRSYLHPLTVVMEHVLSRSPDPVIVEYGPGYSTIVMKRLAPTSRIITVEDREQWLESCKAQFAEAEGNGTSLEGVTLLFHRAGNGYVGAPDEHIRPGTADLVYVDGRRRAACLRHALDLIKPESGIVMLHDAERPFYVLGSRLWPRPRRIRDGGFMNRTLVFAPDAETARSLRGRVEDGGSHASYWARG